MKKIIMTITILFLLVGCTNTPKEQANEEKVTSEEEQPQTVEEKPKTEEEITEEDEEQKEPEESLLTIERLAPPENVVKYFKGEGNEFAQETETVFSKHGNYLPTTVNNGGTVILKVYEITNDALYVVYEQPEYYEDEPPNMEEISSQFARKEILSLPLEEGKTIAGWEVKSINESLTLPIGTIENAIYLEKKEESGSVVRQYWAPEYGLVKKEFYYEEEDGIEMTVTTELEKLKNK